MTSEEVKTKYRNGEISKEMLDLICARNWLYGETNATAYARARRMNADRRKSLLAIYHEHERQFDHQLESMFAGLRTAPALPEPPPFTTC
jgi:hypothetical protein